MRVTVPVSSAKISPSFTPTVGSDHVSVFRNQTSGANANFVRKQTSLNEQKV